MFMFGVGMPFDNLAEEMLDKKKNLQYFPTLQAFGSPFSFFFVLSSIIRPLVLVCLAPIKCERECVERRRRVSHYPPPLLFPISPLIRYSCCRVAGARGKQRNRARAILLTNPLARMKEGRGRRHCL